MTRQGGGLARFKSLTHPEGYGFWLDPDGVATLLGSSVLTYVIFTIAQMGDVFAKAGELWRTTFGDGPIHRIGLLIGLIILGALAVAGYAPRDFSKTGRFHLWMAAVDAAFTLGSMIIWSWPGFEYDRGNPIFDWAMRWCAIASFLVATGVAGVRPRLVARRGWVKAEIERLGKAEWTARITSR